MTGSQQGHKGTFEKRPEGGEGVNQGPPAVMGKGPGQGTRVSWGVAGGLCGWKAVSMDRVVRVKVRKVLRQFS